MSRAHLARNASIPARYRLRTPSPLQTTLVVVARGRRLRLQLRDRGLYFPEPSALSPGTPTDPESSPTVRPSRTLRRTYTRIRPTESHHDPTSGPGESTSVAAEAPLPEADSVSRAVVSRDASQFQVQPGEVHESQSSGLNYGMFLPIMLVHNPFMLSDSDGLAETPITGIQIGTGLFRLVNPSGSSLSMNLLVDGPLEGY